MSGKLYDIKKGRTSVGGPSDDEAPEFPSAVSNVGAIASAEAIGSPSLKLVPKARRIDPRSDPSWKPFIRLPKWAASSSQVTWLEKAVYVALADHFDPARGYAWPSHNKLSKELHISRRRVVDAVDTLERVRWLAIERSKGRFSHRYFFLAVPASNRARPAPLNRAQSAPLESKRTVQTASATVQEASPTVQISSSNGAHRAHDLDLDDLTYKKNSEERDQEKLSPALRAEGLSKKDQDQESTDRGRKRRSRSNSPTATTIPPDFVLTHGRTLYAVRLGLDAGLTFAKWRAYCEAEGIMAVDWDGAWKRACHNEVTYLRDRDQEPNPPPEYARLTDAEISDDDSRRINHYEQLSLGDLIARIGMGRVDLWKKFKKRQPDIKGWNEITLGNWKAVTAALNAAPKPEKPQSGAKR